MKIKIQVAQSKSEYFPKIVDVFKNFPSYSKIDDVHSVEIDENDVLRLEKPFQVVSRWVKTKVSIDGVQLEGRISLYLQLIIRCLKEYKNNYDKEKYCQNLDDSQVQNSQMSFFRCRYIALSNSNDYNAWYNCGKLDEGLIFHVNKDMIRHAVKKEIKSKIIFACPHLDVAKIEDIIASLPDEIDPRKRDDFYYQLDRTKTKIIGVSTNKPNRMSLNISISLGGDKPDLSDLKVQCPRCKNVNTAKDNHCVKCAYSLT